MNNWTKGVIGAIIFFIIVGLIANSSKNSLSTGELLGQYFAIAIFFGLGIIIAKYYMRKRVEIKKKRNSKKSPALD